MHSRRRTGAICVTRDNIRSANSTRRRSKYCTLVQSGGNCTARTSPRFHSPWGPAAPARQRISSSPNTSTRFVSTKPSFSKSAMLGAFCIPIRATSRVRGMGGMPARLVVALALAAEVA